MSMLATGKLPPALLDQLLHRFPMADARLLVGPRSGEDAAVIDYRTAALPPSGTLLVAKTDPITFATDEIGWYAVNVNANDVATMGAQPRWFLATVLLPAGQTDEALVESIFAQIHAACLELGIVLAGGHTEITHGLDRPLVCGTLLGEVAPADLVMTAGAQVGDAVLFIRQAPIEGAALIAREKADDLRRRGVDPAFIARVQGFLHDPGISVVRAAQFVCRQAPIHSLHDPTEGGIATGLWEIARAAQVGLQVDLALVPILPEAATLCQLYDLDPLGTIASGGLLATVAREDALPLVTACRAAGIPATQIGQVVHETQGVHEWRAPDGWTPLREFSADEVTKIF